METKKCNASRAFFVMWILFAFEVSENYAEICEKIDDCSCKKSNGKIINLRKIDGGSTPAFENIKDSDSTKPYVYDWNPCTKFNKGDGCKNVLMCQVATDRTASYPCASTVAKFEVTNGITYITYETDTKDSYKRTFQIGLKCDENKFPGEIASVKEDFQTQNSAYSTTLTSRCACDGGCTAESGQSSSGLSAGSILLIVFFVLLIVYVIGGILINKFKLGVEGMPEMCPNYQFWVGIPSLIKDGVLFTCSGIRSACSTLCQKCNKESYANI